MAKHHNPQRKSVMTHQFSRVPKAEIQRSSFDRSHGIKTTFDGGLLIPILCDEALPGDSFNCRLTAFARMATPIYPIMDNLRMETFFFFVPNRLLWKNWEKFNGAQENPGDSTDFVAPYFQSYDGGFNEGDLEDYFGLPTKIEGIQFSAFWHKAYNLIYNEWFRDQNLQISASFDTENEQGANPQTNGYILQRRGKRHDYFTSCLPFPQKGDPVIVPLGTTAPVGGIGVGASTPQALGTTNVTDALGAQQYEDAYYSDDVSLVTRIFADSGGVTDGIPQIYADLTNASSISINALREAFQIQRLLERDARGGTRYIEIIKSHFGVTSPDYRLQRPEYLGGGSTAININPVPSTVPTSLAGSDPQASLAAYGTATVNNHGFNKSFTEHGVILGLINVRADLTYQQGLNRMWSRSTRYDFYWPALAHLGEQTVLNKEIYAQGTSEDEDVFGYQERYAEYRYKPSQITGLFRSNATGSLDAWHLSQDFASLPTLNTVFIQDTPPIDRVIAVPTEPHFILDGHFQMRCARPMPLYGVPGLIDHF